MMYLIIAAALLPCIYTLSYASYCRKNKNKRAAAGAVLICIIAIASVVISVLPK